MALLLMLLLLRSASGQGLGVQAGVRRIKAGSRGAETVDDAAQAAAAALEVEVSDAEAALSLRQERHEKIRVGDGNCASRGCAATGADDAALAAAVSDGMEESMEALAMYQSAG